jgi:hypothetical protein
VIPAGGPREPMRITGDGSGGSQRIMGALVPCPRYPRGEQRSGDRKEPSGRFYGHALRVLVG